jgi:hypothetical protein
MQFESKTPCPKLSSMVQNGSPNYPSDFEEPEEKVLAMRSVVRKSTVENMYNKTHLQPSPQRDQGD